MINKKNDKLTNFDAVYKPPSSTRRAKVCGQKRLAIALALEPTRPSYDWSVWPFSHFFLWQVSDLLASSVQQLMCVACWIFNRYVGYSRQIRGLNSISNHYFIYSRFKFKTENTPWNKKHWGLSSMMNVETVYLNILACPSVHSVIMMPARWGAAPGLYNNVFVSKLYVCRHTRQGSILNGGKDCSI